MVEATYQLIPLEQLHESPLNPRKQYHPVALEELAASIRAHGVLTPLLARPNAAGFEIAAGHRRYRAAKLAGVGTVPAVVRAMADDEFLEILVVENDQREDVHPLEQAAGYKALMLLDGYDAKRIATRIGRSEKWVYDRVKLLQLIPLAQQLFLADKMTAGHAILLARLTPDQQKKAIAPNEMGLFEHEDLLFDPAGKAEAAATVQKPVSVREFAGWIDQHIKLDPSAIDPALFPETAEVLAPIQERAETLLSISHYQQFGAVEKGHEGIAGPDKWKRADGSGRGKAVCEHSVMGVIVLGPGRGQAFRVCAEKQLCRTHWPKEKKPVSSRSRSSSSSSNDRWKREEAKRQEERKLEEVQEARWKKAVPKILEAVAAAVKKAPTKSTGLLGNLIVQVCSDRSRSRKGAGPAPVPRGTSADDLVRHAAFLVLSDEIQGWRAHVEFPKQAKTLGLDVKKLVDEISPKAAAEKAAPPAKKKGKR